MKTNALKSLKLRRESEAVSLADARRVLAAEATTAYSHRLAGLLAKLAFTAMIALADDGFDNQIPAWLMLHATRGAEDSWSGRTNDAARSRHDGVLSAIGGALTAGLRSGRPRSSPRDRCPC